MWLEFSQSAFILSFWLTLVRNALVTLVTAGFSMNVQQKEKHRLQELPCKATPETHLIDLNLIFESVMPRAYFIQFLNRRGEDDESILDCLDLYQEFQLLMNSLDSMRSEVATLELSQSSTDDMYTAQMQND